MNTCCYKTHEVDKYVYSHQVNSDRKMRGLTKQQTLRVEFLLKTESVYPKESEVTLFTLANPGSSLRFNTNWSAPLI